MPFDKPVFKMLAHNDTGGAVGHQGGFLVPKDLEYYFPKLSGANPTASAFITAELFNGAAYVDTVKTRYQYQTWATTRSPERRVTGNLGAIRSIAKANDIMLIERSSSQPNHYRLSLIRKGTPEYQALLAKTGGKRWGSL